MWPWYFSIEKQTVLLGSKGQMGGPRFTDHTRVLTGLGAARTAATRKSDSSVASPPVGYFSEEALTILASSKAAAQKAVREAKEKSTGVALVGPKEKIFHVHGHLFLGSQFGAVDQQCIRSLGIQHVVNCTAGSMKVENKFASEGVSYSNFELHDKIGENALPSIEKSYEVIAPLESSGKRVLVHCSAGLSRSATIVLGYLMKAKAMSMREAVEVATEGRGRMLQCNASFWSALLQWERKLTGKANAKPSFDFTDWIVEDFMRYGT
mmetsp:Transcript_12632/g.25767  ORF Transcript_12632/g.25767 Transcript_12632/m.25767 type:complete len:266 (+) Transcript_12632:1642-2439(+)